MAAHGAAIEVVGVEQLAQVARDLKAAGDRDLRRELFRGIQRSAKPLKAEAKSAALDELPKSGGLSVEIANSRWSVNTRLGVRNPSIRIVGRGRINESGREHDLNALDRGRLRHPTWGRRGPNDWKNQSVKVHWFSDRMENAADTEVRANILEAVDKVADKLGGSHV